MDCSRRNLALLLPALAAAAAAQPAEGLASQTLKYDDLPVKANGPNNSRAVLAGATHTGYPVELHMTELGPEQAPHPPHKHVNEEILMLRTGMLDVTINGKTTRITAGSTAYVNSNEEHGWRNPGPGRAEYFVIALGPKKS